MRGQKKSIAEKAEERYRKGSREALHHRGWGGEAL
jgi:hypothetical protein